MSLSRLLSGASALVLFAALFVVGTSARADRLKVTPAIEVSQSYETNPTHENDDSRFDKKPDFVTRLTPSIGLFSEGDKGRAHAILGYRQRIYRDVTGLDAVDPFARLRLNRDLTRRLEIFGNVDWDLQEHLDPLGESGSSIIPPVRGDPVISAGRPELERRSYQTGASYLLDRLSQLTAKVGRNTNDYSVTEFSQAQRDLETDYGELSYVQLLSRRDQLLVNLAFGATSFDPIETGREPEFPEWDTPTPRTGQDSDQISATLGWARSWSQSVSTSLTGGVRRVETSGADYVNVFTLDGEPIDLIDDDTSFGFVGGASIEVKGKRGAGELSFNKQTRPGSGRTGSIDIDTLRATYSRKLAERVNFRVTGELGWQESVNQSTALIATNIFAIDPVTGEQVLLTVEDTTCAANPSTKLVTRLENRPQGDAFRRMCAFPVDTLHESKYRRVNTSVDWRIRDRFTTFLSYGFIDYDSSGAIGQSYVDHRFTVGFRYDFDFVVP